MVTIKEGGFYRARNGQKRGPMAINPDLPHLCGVRGVFLRDFYTQTGKRFSGDAETPFDLVAEWVEPAADLQPGPVEALPDPDKPTLWDRYAMAAITGIASRVVVSTPVERAANAANYADAMMAERAKRFPAG